MYIFVVLRILEPGQHSVTGEIIISYIEDRYKLQVSAIKHDKMGEICGKTDLFLKPHKKGPFGNMNWRITLK